MITPILSSLDWLQIFVAKLPAAIFSLYIVLFQKSYRFVSHVKFVVSLKANSAKNIVFSLLSEKIYLPFRIFSLEEKRSVHPISMPLKNTKNEL
jgi:hypothetical protein